MEHEGKLVLDRNIMERMPFMSQFKVKRDFMVDIGQKTAQDIMFDEINVRIEKLCAVDLVAADHEVVEFRWPYPTSTWQTFKDNHNDSWWLRWLVRRRPVQWRHETQTKVVLINRYLGYPDAVIQSVKLGKPFIFEDVKVLDLDD